MINNWYAIKLTGSVPVRLDRLVMIYLYCIRIKNTN